MAPHKPKTQSRHARKRARQESPSGPEVDPSQATVSTLSRSQSSNSVVPMVRTANAARRGSETIIIDRDGGDQSSDVNDPSTDNHPQSDDEDSEAELSWYLYNIC
jgi:hypothetical protein